MMGPVGCSWSDCCWRLLDGYSRGICFMICRGRWITWRASAAILGGHILMRLLAKMRAAISPAICERQEGDGFRGRVPSHEVVRVAGRAVGALVGAVRLPLAVQRSMELPRRCHVYVLQVW